MYRDVEHSQIISSVDQVQYHPDDPDGDDTGDDDVEVYDVFYQWLLIRLTKAVSKMTVSQVNISWLLHIKL